MKEENSKKEYVDLASGLGLSNAKCGREAEWKDYFVLGYLINKGQTAEYEENGYVENDSCSSLWTGWTNSGLSRPVVNESIYWLINNGYISQIWMEGPRLGYKVAQWVLDKVDARITKELIDSCDATIDGLKEEKLKIDQDQLGAAEAKRRADAYDSAVEAILRDRDSRLKKKYDIAINRLKNVDCGISEEAD